MYRKMFNLSWQEYMEEPVRIQMMNSAIEIIRVQKENKAIKK